MDTPAQPPIQEIPQNPIIQPVPPVSQIPQAPSIPPTPSTPPTTVMPAPKKPLILIIALIALIVLAAIIYTMKGSSSPDIKNKPITPPSPVITQEALPTDTLLPTGTGETQLDQDIQNIDATIGTAESDLTNIEQGLNDQSVDLTE